MLHLQDLQRWLRDFGWVVGFEGSFKARLRLPIAGDAGLISWVTSSGSFSSLEYGGHQMLGLASKRLASSKHEGRRLRMKV
jgi:hypothetical protein